MNAENIRILIVDDEMIVRSSLKSGLEEDGYGIDTAASAEDALKMLQDHTYSIILLDIKMPGMDGIELLRRVKQVNPNIEVVMITAYATIESAVEAMKIGAFDYITKPFEPDEVGLIIKKIITHRNLLEENIRLKESLVATTRHGELIGESDAIREILKSVEDVAPSEAPVLITGESGTGKELVARAIHFQSKRRYMPLVVVSCGAIPESLIESELFGHEKGSFTGAQYKKKGRVELADGGTLFLDEVGELSPKTQVDLLRVLQEKEFVRVGGTKPIQSDFRIIAATNRNLQEMVRRGDFREDLYYRLNVIHIHLPPLRDRPEDIPLLAEHFLKRYCLATNKRIHGFTPASVDLMKRHPWPGNVRELENAVERSVVLAKTGYIQPIDLPPLAGEGTPGPTASLDEVEKQHILKTLSAVDWNIKRASEIMGIERATLYNKIRRYGLQRPPKGDRKE
jgi:DNA-binding NtrC family response regulator